MVLEIYGVGADAVIFDYSAGVGIEGGRVFLTQKSISIKC